MVTVEMNTLSNTNNNVIIGIQERTDMSIKVLNQSDTYKGNINQSERGPRQWAGL